MRSLSKQQEAVLRYCGEFYAVNDQLPPRYIISNRFGWASVNAAECVVAALRRKGYVEFNELGKLRFTAKGRAYIVDSLTAARWFPTNGSSSPTDGSVCATSAV